MKSFSPVVLAWASLSRDQIKYALKSPGGESLTDHFVNLPKPIRGMFNVWSLVSRILVLSVISISLKILCDDVTAAEASANTVPPALELPAEKLAETARQSVAIISQLGRDGREGGVGAGFVIAPDGLIATSLHVIGESRPVTVQFANGQRHDVTEIHAWDRKLDLAIVRIDARGLPALSLGDSDALKQGASVVAMGNPLGLELSFVSGLVSARRDFNGLPMIQLAIPIEPGNSGGPLLDRQGRVHGILNMKSLIAPNLGFATPINALKPLLEKPNRVPMSRWITLNSLNPREWKPIFGARWRQRGGRIEVDGAGQGFGGRALCLSQAEPPERPFEIGVTVRLDDESGAAGLTWAADGEDKHYGFYPSAGQLRLTRFDGPNVFAWTILRQVPSIHYQPGEWNRLKVRVEKGKILCYVNGQLVIESDDDGLTGGRAGLAKFRDTKAGFKNFQVGASVRGSEDELDPAQAAKLRETITSVSGKTSADLLTALQHHATEGQPLFIERAQQLEREAAQLRETAGKLHRQSVQQELIRHLAQPEAQVDLAYAALLLTRLDNPDVDVAAYRRQIDDMAKDLTSRWTGDVSEVERLTALKKFMFEESGFHGSRSDYYNRANSYLSDTLDDREGLPITLSVLFIELARKAGLPNVAGLPLPGHFMVKFTPTKGEPQIIDVFDGGRTLSFSEADEIASDFQRLPVRSELMAPATNREIIVRMLRNLIGVAARGGTPASALPYLDVVLALTPDAAEDRLQRAQLRIRTGDRDGAREDLKWLLDHTPEGDDRERMTELYRNL